MKRKIACLTLQKGFDNYHDELKNAYPDTEAVTVASEGSYDILAKKAKLLPSLGYDVIAAKGFTLSLIKDLVDIPLIPLEPDAIDLFKSLNEANLEENTPVGLVLHTSNSLLERNNLGPLLEEIFHIKVSIFSYDTMTDYFPLVQDIINRGIIPCTGKSGVDLAKELNVKVIPLYPGLSAFRNTIEEAIHIIDIRRMDHMHAQMLEEILNTNSEGVISLTNSLDIQWMNSFARNIFSIQEGDSYKSIDVKELFPDIAFNNLLKRNYDNIIFNNKNKKQYVINSKIIENYNNSKDLYLFIKPASHIVEAEKRLRAEIQKKGQTTKYILDDIRGNSEAIIKAKEATTRCAKHDSNVLIYGETGSGKELFAQCIHNLSSRKNNPFFAVNCAALTESILNSELFGYSEGSFTGAKRGGKPGIFEMAHTGTVFLDEIGELSLQSQSALLRVLQEKEIRRIGDDSIIPIDVRIISASHRDIYKAVQEGKFRQDLFYRLGTVFLPIPPLRERKDDIVPLLYDCIDEYSAKNKIFFEGQFTQDAKKYLMSYPWNGNVRELKNFVQRIFSLDYNQSIITAKEASLLLSNSPHELTVSTETVTLSQESLNFNTNQKVAKPTFTRDEIYDAIRQCGGNKAAAARLLGINRTHLWRILKEFDAKETI